LQTHN